jgi:hypothetical protein
MRGKSFSFLAYKKIARHAQCPSPDLARHGYPNPEIATTSILEILKLATGPATGRLQGKTMFLV